MGLVKATLSLVSSPEPRTPSMDVMFNPSEYSISRNVTYAEIAVPGLAMPLLQFIRGESQVLSLELFLDSSDRKQPSPLAALGGGAVDLVHNTGANVLPVAADQWSTLAASPHCEHRLQALRMLAQIDGHLHAPHVIGFSWGGARFQGVVTSYLEKFTLFDDQGQIQRARVTLQVKSFQSAGTQYQLINPQSPDRTKTVVVRAGERLDMIAAREYGDPSHWPVIAAANGLARPRVLPAGTLLTIPRSNRTAMPIQIERMNTAVEILPPTTEGSTERRDHRPVAGVEAAVGTLVGRIMADELERFLRNRGM